MVTPKTNRLVELLRLSGPACALAYGLLLPFLHKAYAIDDPYFLLQAQQVARQFLHPLNFDLCWFWPVTCGPAYTVAPGGALLGYFLMPLIRFADFEPLIHGVQLIFLTAAVLATISLALRLGAKPSEARTAGMLLVTFPPVLAMTNTVMPDVLAFRERQRSEDGNARVREEIGRLQKELETAQRAARRQAAPFSRGQRKSNPRSPGRKSGKALRRAPLIRMLTCHRKWARNREG